MTARLTRCTLCPTAAIHRVHEPLEQFESLRSSRRPDRVLFWASLILGAPRRSARRSMTAEQAESLAWKLQATVEDELKRNP